jgi:hypothetical protein
LVPRENESAAVPLTVSRSESKSEAIIAGTRSGLPPASDPADPPGPTSDEQRIAVAETSERSSAENTSESSGDSGMQETGSNTALTKSAAATPEILPAESESSSSSLQKANASSLKLIDDSAKHLFGLMEGIAKDAPKPDDARRLDPQRVNAACNCAKQIHSLLKLKLDIHNGRREK